MQKGPAVDELFEYLDDKFNDDARDVVNLREHASASTENSQKRNEQYYSKRHILCLCNAEFTLSFRVFSRYV